MSHVIGLTGGIGCGKSLVSHYLQSKHYTVIDADLIAREIMEPGHQGLVQVRETLASRSSKVMGRWIVKN